MIKTMTDRERFLATLRLEEVDRPIRNETIGVDNDTYIRWKEEGWEAPEGATDHMIQFDMDKVAPAFFWFPPLPWILSNLQ